MNTLFNFLKGTIELLIILWVIGVVTRIFLYRTVFGRLMLISFKGMTFTTKLGYRMIKKLGIFSYKESKEIYKFLNKQYKKLDNKKQTKNTEKKVVNGNTNVIDLKKFMAEKQQNKSR